MFAVTTVLGSLALNETHCTYNGESRLHEHNIRVEDLVNPQKVNSSMYRFGDNLTIDFKTCTVLEEAVYAGIFNGEKYNYDFKTVHFANGSELRLRESIAPETFYPFGDVLVNPELRVYFDLKSSSGKAVRFNSTFNLTSLRRNDFFEEQVYDYDDDSVISFSNGDFIILPKKSLEKAVAKPIIIEKIVEKTVEKIVEKPQECPKINCDNKALQEEVNELTNAQKQEKQQVENCKNDMQRCQQDAEAVAQEENALRQRLEEEAKQKTQAEQELRVCSKSLVEHEKDPTVVCKEDRPSDRRLRRLELLEFGLTCLGLVGLFVFVAMM